MPPPTLITFDIFGTVLDWHRGLEASCREAGRPLQVGEFDRVIDRQAELERDGRLDYATITRISLVEILGLELARAAAIGHAVGRWPLFGDAGSLRDLMRLAPCAAMTNSDRAHGEDVQDQLGFRLNDWLCAEAAGLYKPNPGFWRQMSQRREIPPGPEWWHVSAYADYDLAAAASLGLTTILVRRPHCRPAPATHEVDDLHGLLRLLTGTASNITLPRATAAGRIA